MNVRDYTMCTCFTAESCPLHNADERVQICRHEMTEAQFIAFYCRNSSATAETFKKYKVALRCYCEHSSCLGWAAIPNNPEWIEQHKRTDGNEVNQRAPVATRSETERHGS